MIFSIKRLINHILISSSMVGLHIFIGWVVNFTYVLDVFYILIFPKSNSIINSFNTPYVDTMDDIVIPLFVIWLKVYIIVLIIDFLFFQKTKKKSRKIKR